MYTDEFKKAIAEIQVRSYTIFSNLRFNDIKLDKEIKLLKESIDKLLSLNSIVESVAPKQPLIRKKKI